MHKKSLIRQFIKESLLIDAKNQELKSFVDVTGKGVILLCRQDSFVLDRALGSTLSRLAAKIIGQGHMFVVIVDPKTGKSFRYDFGRYTEAERCNDDRLVSKIGEKIFGRRRWGGLGIHTMGITQKRTGKVLAKFAADGITITNLAEFCQGIKNDEEPGNVVVIPVNNIGNALEVANSYVDVCHPYAIPISDDLMDVISIPLAQSFAGTPLSKNAIFELLNKTAINCGTFSLKILNAGSPIQPLVISEDTLIDTPDKLYETAAKLPVQSGTL